MKKIRKLLVMLVTTSLLASCTGDDPSRDDLDEMPADVKEALTSLRSASMLQSTSDGLPTYLVGDLGKVEAMSSDDHVAADAVLRPALRPVLKAFRLSPADLKLQQLHADTSGDRHLRYTQMFRGLDVVGGDLVVHVDRAGTIYSINGFARGDISDSLGATPISKAQALLAIASDARFRTLEPESTRVVYLQTAERVIYKAYDVVMAGSREDAPVRDNVFVDVETGAIVAVYPQIQDALNRQVHDAMTGTGLPGTLRRGEGQPPAGDPEVNAVYDNVGFAYEAYRRMFERDSYNGAGARLDVSIHYKKNDCNASWTGSQLTFGDGDGTTCRPMGGALDIVGHELTHAVTANESRLVYSGESGGMNESLSDIFGAFVEAWVAGGKNYQLEVTPNTFLVAESRRDTPFRWMCDPATDGHSADRWTSGVGSLDVHYSSGIGNLAFCLLTKGGSHPRGSTNVIVNGVGMQTATWIFYKAQRDILTSTSQYKDFRTATEQAAAQMDPDVREAVSCAWAAVGVGDAPADCIKPAPNLVPRNIREVNFCPDYQWGWCPGYAWDPPGPGAYHYEIRLTYPNSFEWWRLGGATQTGQTGGLMNYDFAAPMRIRVTDAAGTPLGPLVYLGQMEICGWYSGC